MNGNPRFHPSLLAFAALCAAVSACGAKDQSKLRPAESIAIERYQPEADQGYLLERGDTISVAFYNNPELNQRDIVIRPDGAIALPLIGDVQAAGRTPAQLGREINDRYGGELARPQATVIVRRLGSYQVHVGGEVEKDGVIRMRGPITVTEAIQRAGGFADTADTERVVIIRKDAEGHRVGYLVDLSQVLSGTEPGQDVMLRPADIVFVPRSTIARLNLAVEQYVRNMLPIQPGFGFTP